jgi:uncharacterized protein YegJ (DUF2314 family)
MSERVFLFDGGDQRMRQAFEAAQRSFKFFWRELYWERRRIVPGLDMAMIKLPFTDGPRSDGKPQFEHMWVDDVDFDGDSLSGHLVNAPNWLTSVNKGDPVKVPFPHLTDWMMTVDGKAFGGYTVNLMRAQMGAQQRREHDQAWGLDFGDPNNIRTEIGRDGEKKGILARLFGRRDGSNGADGDFTDHPMCINMLQKIESQLQDDQSIARSTDNDGWTLLQRESLAGNLGVVRLLVRYGSDVSAKTATGRTAADLAAIIGWSAIASILEQQRKA